MELMGKIVFLVQLVQLVVVQVLQIHYQEQVVQEVVQVLFLK